MPLDFLSLGFDLQCPSFFRLRSSPKGKLGLPDFIRFFSDGNCSLASGRFFRFLLACAISEFVMLFANNGT